MEDDVKEDFLFRRAVDDRDTSFEMFNIINHFL